MNGFAGTGVLVRLALRRDQVMLPVWIALFAVMAGGSAAATVGLYPTLGSRAQAAGSINDIPSLVAMYGKVYDPNSLGAIAMIKLGGLGAALVAVLAIMTVIRHTRADEESGRMELLGAGVLGRFAALTASLTVAVGACVLLGLATASALQAAGLPATGAFAFGLGWTGAGVAFAAVAAVVAQLTASARAARGIASAVLGATYLFRAIGDTADASGAQWLTWASPIGWTQQLRPFADERWWVLSLPLAFAAVLGVMAYALVSRRDLDTGLLPDRPGRATASAALRGPLGLAWRLHRGSLFGWIAGFAVLGVVFGNAASSVDALVTSPQARELFLALGGRHGLIDAFLATEFSFIGIGASVYAVQAAIRLRAEEAGLHAELLLGGPVSRIGWAASHIVIAVLGSTVLMAVAGLAAGLGSGAHTGDIGAEVLRLTGAALVQLPAVWVLVGVVVAAFGLGSQVVVAAWAALVAFLLIGELGPLLRLDQWVMDISPFSHVPRLPGGQLTVTPLLWLTAIAVALTAAGLVCLRRRDIG